MAAGQTVGKHSSLHEPKKPELQRAHKSGTEVRCPMLNVIERTYDVRRD